MSDCGRFITKVGFTLTLISRYSKASSSNGKTCLYLATEETPEEPPKKAKKTRKRAKKADESDESESE